MNTTIARQRFQTIALATVGATIFAGFAKTYFLKYLFDTPPLTQAAHLHGLLATLWIILHYTQARLIAAHRVDLHKRLGIFAACVAVLVVIQAASLGIHNVALGRAPPGRNPLQFLSVSLGTTTVFAVFVASALALRRHREWHKRLMLLATINLLVPAMGRFDSQIMVPLGLPRRVLGTVLISAFVAWACANDWRNSRRIHPAYLIGGTALLVSVPGRAWLGMTDAWLPFAEWLVK
jgi:hypothetical protein